MFQQPVKEPKAKAIWELIAEFLTFILKLFVFPRKLIRNCDWDNQSFRLSIVLFVLAGLAILIFSFGDNRVLANEGKPLLSTFKGVVMRAHDRSWDWLEPVYTPFKIGQGEAKRLWDTLLTRGFLTYTYLASLIGLCIVIRLRMWRYGLGLNHALGTGLLGYLSAAILGSLSLVPLMQLLICRHCLVRLSLFILLNIASWVYLGFYTLGDLGERPQSPINHLGKCIGYGLVQYVIAYVCFFVLIVIIIPM